MLNRNEFDSGLPHFKSLPTLTGVPSSLETPSLPPLLENCTLTPSHHTLPLSTLHYFPYKATGSSNPGTGADD